MLKSYENSFLKETQLPVSNDNRQLCEELMHADTEERVVELLSTAEYWDDDSVWRQLGDNENNFSIIGNQQADAIGALAEKVVNSIDARLINAVLAAGVSNDSPESPSSIREAVSKFIENNAGYDPDRHGMIRNWSRSEISKHANLVTVAATGSKPGGSSNPCISIADQGEGQSPGAFPDTFMSLQRSNKLRIPYVQGKFNMGGTGALQFCSRNFNLQLVLSRRNPALLPRRNQTNDRDHDWGFTVVRRKAPTGDIRSSVYEYLAPFDADKAILFRGDVLSFQADTMPIFPSGGSGMAYIKSSTFGSLVKLYEYEWGGDKSDITRSTGGGRQGLLKRLETKVADPALPFRLYECRDYRSQGPYHNGIGIVNSVENRSEDLELTDGADISVSGYRLPTKIYLFKPGEGSEQRRADSGVLFLVNGQTHGAMHSRFFERRNVGKSYIKNDLLVTVDCSEIDGRDREDLFMNSRDRLRRGDTANQLERELEQTLNLSPSLRKANRERRISALRDSMTSSETVSKVLRDLFSNNRELARYLMEGGNIGFTREAIDDATPPDFSRYPTFIQFKQTRSNRLRRDGEIGRRVTVSLESDADSSYFDRVDSPGRWRIENGAGEDVSGSWRRTGPDEGQINFTSQLPSSAMPGGWLKFTIIVDDDAPQRTEPFNNYLTIDLKSPIDDKISGSESQRNPIRHRYDPPNWHPVERIGWQLHGFQEESALKIAQTGEENVQAYDFFVNVDNRHLLLHTQGSTEELEANRLIFGNALTLVGLALIREYSERVTPEEADSGDIMTMDEYVLHVTSGVAPVLLPMLKSFVQDQSTETS